MVTENSSTVSSSSVNVSSGPTNFTCGWCQDFLLATTENWEEHEAEMKEQNEASTSLAVASLIIGLFGLLSNSQIIAFYWSKKKSLVPSLYLALSTNDLIVCLTAILHFIALLVVIEATDKEATVLTLFLGMVYSLTTLILRVSVFVNVVLAVVRTINITKPFYEINRKRMWIAILLCPLILLPVIIYDAIQIGEKQPYESKIRYVFLPYVGDRTIIDIVVSAMNIKVKGKKKFIMIPAALTFSTSCAPFIMAVIISLVCLGINWKILSSNKKRLSEVKGAQASRKSRNEQKITVTIAMLTVVFSICNIVYAAFLSVYLIRKLKYSENLVLLKLSYVTSTIFPFVSSALNSVILIMRSRKLRDSVRNMFSKGQPPLLETRLSTIECNESAIGHQRISVSSST